MKDIHQKFIGILAGLIVACLILTIFPMPVSAAWGTAQVLKNETLCTDYEMHPINSTTFLVSYDTASGPYFRVITHSGSSITLGTAYQPYNAAGMDDTSSCVFSTSTFGYAYRNDSDSGHLWIGIGTISGTVLSFGPINSDTGVVGQDPSITDWTATKGAMCARISANGNIDLWGFTWSGTTITRGAPVAVSVSNCNVQTDIIAIDPNYVAVVYSIPTDGIYCAYEYSASGVEWTSGNSFKAASSVPAYNVEILKYDSTHYILSYSLSSNNKLICALWNGTNAFTFGTPVNINTAYSLTGLSTYYTGYFLATGSNVSEAYVVKCSLSGTTIAVTTWYSLPTSQPAQPFQIQYLDAYENGRFCSMYDDSNGYPALSINSLISTPTASFSVTPSARTTSTTLTFTDTSDDGGGSISNWTWTFGDGTTSYEQSPTHKYANAGTFTVTLWVTNNIASDDAVTNLTISGAAGGNADLNFYGQWTWLFGLIMCFLLSLMCAWNGGMNIDGTIFLGVLSVCMAVMAWQSMLPIWILIFSAAILVYMIYGRLSR